MSNIALHLIYNILNHKSSLKTIANNQAAHLLAHNRTLVDLIYWSLKQYCEKVKKRLQHFAKFIYPAVEQLNKDSLKLCSKAGTFFPQCDIPLSLRQTIPEHIQYKIKPRFNYLAACFLSLINFSECFSPSHGEMPYSAFHPILLPLGS